MAPAQRARPATRLSMSACIAALAVGAGAPICLAQHSITFFKPPYASPVYQAQQLRVCDMSADGSMVAGAAYWSSGTGPDGQNFETWRWTLAGGYTHFGYGETSGDTDHPLQLTQHGEHVVYTTIAGGMTEVVRWNAPGSTVELPRPANAASVAYDVSADGQVVVGKAGHSAVWWFQNGFGGYLGTLPGAPDDQSNAWATNHDGSVIVGWSYSATGMQAFRWTNATGCRGSANCS